jgi:pyruvate/2-oxoglutarate dehydrogenase complex dihydrolipoamide dehydrogenase (E3) component
MATTYDAIVIGAGPAGEEAAGRLADEGLSVAICERELVAGECKYWACIPSKTLLRSGEAYVAARQVPGAREAVTGEIDAAAALEWRDFMVSDWDDSGKTGWLEEKGIDLYRGSGRFLEPGKLSVGEAEISSERIVIASGSDPVMPPVDGLEGLDGLWTNREATETKEVPARLLILGAGPVGVELGQAFTRLGAGVVIVERDERVIAKEHASAGEVLAKAFEREGIELRLGATATSAARHGDGFALTLEGGEELRGDRLLVATGRRPRSSELGLENAGVRTDEQGNVQVDERLRAADGVWAVGDVTGIMPFTHVGKYQARIAVADIAGRSARADYRAVPRVVFTDPQVAAVGETEGKREGTNSLQSISRTSTYTREYEQVEGFLKLFADDTKLVGAVAVGPEAGEWLGQATLAVRAGVPVDLLKDTIQPFPTFSEAFVNALIDLDA